MARTGWRLAQERTRAETCVVWLKKYGDAASKDRGALAYGQAKAEYDGVIAGLVVALARKGPSPFHGSTSGWRGVG